MGCTSTPWYVVYFCHRDIRVNNKSVVISQRPASRACVAVALLTLSTGESVKRSRFSRLNRACVRGCVRACLPSQQDGLVDHHVERREQDITALITSDWLQQSVAMVVQGSYPHPPFRVMNF